LERSERKWSQPEILLRKKFEKWADILLRKKNGKMGQRGQKQPIRARHREKEIWP
jgi:ribosome-binding protein aMBF1 (putative translation factor)